MRQAHTVYWKPCREGKGAPGRAARMRRLLRASAIRRLPAAGLLSAGLLGWTSGEAGIMRLLPNTGTERVVDELRATLVAGSTLDIATPALSVFAFGELRDLLSRLTNCRLVLPSPSANGLGLLGGEADRPYRNRLQTRWLATELAAWLEAAVEVRAARGAIPQSALIARSEPSESRSAVTGTCSFTTPGLGIAPSSDLSLVQITDGADEADRLSKWFEALWSSIPAADDAKRTLLHQVGVLSANRSPAFIYFLALHHLFQGAEGDLDEDRIIKSATGIRETTIWEEAVQIPAPMASSVRSTRSTDSAAASSRTASASVRRSRRWRSSSTTSSAMTVSWCSSPSAFRDNWSLYKANDRRNILASDRFNYDILNHTDLSRDGGMSGDIDLSYVNWGNYDLVVIDESHNFRNKNSTTDGETRYDRLMRRIIKEGVKTRVLMLSATPVNNRLADLKNQIAFVTSAEDAALAPARYSQHREYGSAGADTVQSLVPASRCRPPPWTSP